MSFSPLEQNNARSNLRRVVKCLFEELQLEGLRAAFFVGSVATNEETLRFDSSGRLEVSDIDIILDLSLSTYAKFRLLNISQQISKELTLKLAEKGYKTNVSIGLTCFNIAKYLPSVNPNAIFLFELNPFYSKKREKYSVKQYSIIPTKINCLDLAVSSIADYVFLKADLSLSTNAKCYTIAKRCLTLLNSLMLFEGLIFKGYNKRFEAVKKNFSKLYSVLSEDDIKYFEAFTLFKLTGNICPVTKVFETSAENLDNLIPRLDLYFRGLASRVLIHELQGCIENVDNSRDLQHLIIQYVEINKLSHIDSLLSSFKILPAVLSLDKKRVKIALYSIFSKKLQINVALRFLIMRSFVDIDRVTSTQDISITERMWELFPV